MSLKYFTIFLKEVEWQCRQMRASFAVDPRPISLSTNQKEKF